MPAVGRQVGSWCRYIGSASCGDDAPLPGAVHYPTSQFSRLNDNDAGSVRMMGTITTITTTRGPLRTIHRIVRHRRLTQTCYPPRGSRTVYVFMFRWSAIFACREFIGVCLGSFRLARPNSCRCYGNFIVRIIQPDRGHNASNPALWQANNEPRTRTSPPQTSTASTAGRCTTIWLLSLRQKHRQRGRSSTLPKPDAPTVMGLHGSRSERT